MEKTIYVYRNKVRIQSGWFLDEAGRVELENPLRKGEIAEVHEFDGTGKPVTYIIKPDKK